MQRLGRDQWIELVRIAPVTSPVTSREGPSIARTSTHPTIDYVGSSFGQRQVFLAANA